MTLLYIDSLSFYIWTIVIMLMSMGIGYIYSGIIQNKKHKYIPYLNDSLVMPLLAKIIHDTESDLIKLQMILNVLLDESITYEGKIMLIKKAIIGNYDRELRMKEPSFCMILQTTCNNIKDYYNCLECETYIHYRDIYLKEQVEE